MFNLSVELVLRGNDRRIINCSEFGKFLKMRLASFIDSQNIYEELPFEMTCANVKSGVKWSIDCNSYDNTLKFVQGIFGMGELIYCEHSFEVMSLDMKEIAQSKPEFRVASFA